MASTAGAIPISAETGGAAATPDQPATTSRLASLDFIRGIAVMGIVIANMDGFGALSLEHQWPVVDGPLTMGEEAVWLFEFLFVDGKFRGLFSVLFGAGMAIFMERALAKGSSALWLQLRRLFWLAIFGLAHMMLLYSGDILWNYALTGFVTIWLIRFVPARWLLGIGMLAYIGSTYGPATDIWGYVEFEQAAQADPGSDLAREYESEIAAEVADTRASGEIMAEGSFVEIVRHKVEETKGPYLFDHPERYMLEYGPLMLIGAGLYGLGFFGGGWNRRKLLLWGGAGIAVSAAVALYLGLWLIEAGHPRALNLWGFYGPSNAYRIWMILGLVAVMVAMAPRWVPSALGQRIAAAGRMAFSNYIGTSLLMAIVFQGWGLGLYNQLDKVERFALVLLPWALMLLWSKPWLARYRFGPLEWAWRCLTYWQLFPLRREAKAAA